MEAPATTVKPRLGYVDWMRGLACLLMFQTHCYDSWLGPAGRKTTFFMWSQLIGTLPAPLFLFLAGISFALVTEKLRKRSVPHATIAITTVRRGAEILGIGVLFRLQQFLFNRRWAPWSDLLRVDILNTIGLCMMLMGGICWVGGWLERGLPPAVKDSGIDRSRSITVLLAIATAAAVALFTPPLWSSFRPHWLPWPLESYINGVHTYGEPRGYFFPIFPWAGFAFVGLATGFLLLSDWARRREAKVFVLAGAAGLICIVLGRWIERLPGQYYRASNFWTTSPEFFLIRVGLLLIILFVVYGWCRWGAGQFGFSPVIQLGQTSLLVYWVHIEFVYDRMSILPSHANSIRVASLGLLFIAVFMLVLSMIRTRVKKKQSAVSTQPSAQASKLVSSRAERGIGS